MTAVRYFILGIVIFPLLMFLQSFIGCWFGTQYLLDELIVNLLILNIFLLLHNGTVLIFIGANGMFSDIWAVWTEFFLNIVITLLLAPHYGIIGILIGKIVSIAFSGAFWKPYFLFTSGFHKSVFLFFCRYSYPHQRMDSYTLRRLIHYAYHSWFDSICTTSLILLHLFILPYNRNEEFRCKKTFLL